MAKIKHDRAMVEGIGQWLQFPERIVAPSPEDKQVPAIFRLACGDSYKLAQIGRRQLIFELWSVVLGTPPPVPGCKHRNEPREGELL